MSKKKLIISILIVFILIMVLSIIVSQINKINEEKAMTEERSDGGVPYDDSQLNNFEITIEGMDKDIKKEIKDEDTFYLEFKKYIYFNGLVDANIATVEYQEVYQQDIRLIFALNNTSRTKIRCIIHTTEGTYEFFEDKS